MLSRVLGILGTVRSGSTPLGMALGSHPDAGFVGETHHVLADRIEAYKKARNELPMCPVCREACLVWRPSEMPMSPKGLFHLLSDRLGKAVVIDSSKYAASFAVYEEENPDVDFRYAITIKTPDRQVASFRRYKYNDPAGWAATYQGEYAAIADFVKGKRFAVIDYRDLVTEPVRVLHRVASLLEIPVEPMNPTVYPPAHQIPGNDRAIKAQKPVDGNADTDWTKFSVDIPTSILRQMLDTYAFVRSLDANW